MAERTPASGDACSMPCVHLEEVLSARASLQADRVYQDLAALFGALADPTRVRIVHTLLHSELCTCDLAAVLGITESAVSQHLRVLRALRLVRSRREGKFVYHSLDDDHVANLVDVGLSHQREQAAVPEMNAGLPRAQRAAG